MTSLYTHHPSCPPSHLLHLDPCRGQGTAKLIHPSQSLPSDRKMTPLCPGRCRPCSAAVWAVLVVASLGGGGTPWALSFRPTPSIPLRIGRCDKLFVRTNRSVERSLGGWEAEEEAGLIHADGLTEGWVRPGTSDEMVVLREIMVPPEGFDLASALSRSGSGLDSGTCLRLDLSPANVTVPVALALLDPAEYPTLTRARKACRRGSVVIYAGQDGPGRRGKVADRIIPGDILGIQVRADRGAPQACPQASHAPRRRPSLRSTSPSAARTAPSSRIAAFVR